MLKRSTKSSSWFISAMKFSFLSGRSNLVHTRISGRVKIMKLWQRYLSRNSPCSTGKSQNALLCSTLGISPAVRPGAASVRLSSGLRVSMNRPSKSGAKIRKLLIFQANNIAQNSKVLNEAFLPPKYEQVHLSSLQTITMSDSSQKFDECEASNQNYCLLVQSRWTITELFPMQFQSRH